MMVISALGNQNSIIACILSTTNVHDLSNIVQCVSEKNIMKVMTFDANIFSFCHIFKFLYFQLSLKVVDQMLKLGWEGDGLGPLIR